MMKSLFILSLSLISIFADEIALQELTSANNLFTASVYKEILKTGKQNFLVSPFSAETVIAFAQSGAENETAQEIRTSLHLPMSQEKIETSFKALLPSLKSSQDYSLETANKMYVKKDYPIKDGFKKIAADVFSADLENVDFSLKEEAAKTINEWVEEKTQNKIHNLINPKALEDMTVAILVNALYFKGNWTKQFRNSFTKQAPFYETAKNVVQVDTMYSTNEDYNYYENEELNATFLELPFEGEDVSMTIVLPNEKEGLADLENQIEKMLLPQKFTKETVTVGLPKFKIESELDFKEILINLGVSKAFTRGEADFSGIASEKGDLYINEVLQKTFINVNEEGVEAAAATYADLVSRIAHQFKYPIKVFNADHPFLFYIKVKDLIIFVGRVLLPSY